MTSLKPLRKVTRGVSMGKDIQAGRGGNGYQVTQREHVLSGVEKCHSGTWLLEMLD